MAGGKRGKKKILRRRVSSKPEAEGKEDIVRSLLLQKRSASRANTGSVPTRGEGITLRRSKKGGEREKNHR